MSAQPAEIEAAVVDEGGVPGAVRRWFANVRAGDAGSLPVIAALLVITVFFQSKNSNFLSAGNLTNLLVQMAAVTIIAYGVVFVLLLGEIDLSIGYVSGVAGVVVAKLQDPGFAHQTSGVVAILVAVAVGALIGVVQGSFVAILGVPSFVVTLAFLLALQGVIIKAVGSEGVIGIENDTVNNMANYYLSDAWGWAVAVAVTAGYALATLGGIISRRRAGLPAGDPVLAVIRLVAIGAATFAVVAITNRSLGLPFAAVLMVALLLFWSYVATRTTFGRHVYAVGGSAEAARRAGINVRFIRIAVFAISGAMAALGGVVFAARLSSVDLNAGGGTILLDAISAAVIGGTSLFGGRGKVKSALLGSLVIATLASGVNLVGYSAATQYIITGAILLAAVTLDTVSRRRLAAAGR